MVGFDRFQMVAAFLSLVLIGMCACSRSPLERPSTAPEIASVIAVRPLAEVHPVLGVDDRIHLAYELLVVNFSSAIVNLDRVEALSASGGKLDELAGDALVKRMRISGGESGKILGASHSGFILMDVSLPKTSALPTTIRHRITTTRQLRAAPDDDHHGIPLPPESPIEASATFVGAETTVDPSPAIAISSPLRGPGWLVGNGCCDELNPHRGAVIAINGAQYAPERFAIDFVQLDHDHRLFSGPVGNLSSYAYFGAPVYSVADGTVIRVEDGAAEEIPGALPPGKKLSALAGNHVIMDLGTGHFAVYAHLQLRSIRVKIGDRLHRGDVLGRLGNTGNSSNPHLHFHIMDRPSALASNGLPFVITNLVTAGVATGFDPIFSDEPAVIDPQMAGSRPRRLPLNNHVVAFE